MTQGKCISTRSTGEPWAARARADWLSGCNSLLKNINRFFIATGQPYVLGFLAVFTGLSGAKFSATPFEVAGPRQD